MKKVIYILSVGHSGSTLLDITLGQFKNTFSTGELKHLTWQFYREITNDSTTQKCTCGKSFDKCKVWGNIINGLAEYKRIDKNHVPIQLSIKHLDSLSFFENPKWLKLLRVLYKLNLSLKPNILFAFHSLLKRTNQNNKLIYDNLFKSYPNVNYIIDSSKDIIRYNELRHKVAFFPIILIRDIEQIEKSQYLKHTNKVKKAWLKYYNHQVLPIIKKMPEENYHIINYELFINNPFEEIKKLGQKLNIDVQDFSKNISMAEYHLVAGNPMRYETEINIRQKSYTKEQVLSNLEKAGLNSFYLERI